jgi:hypothetical protein
MAAEAQVQAVPYLKRSRSVWFVLFTSTVLFCVICSASGVGLYGYLVNVTRTRGATLQLVHGTQLTVVRHQLVDPEAVQNTAGVNEGDQVRAGDDTQASIRLFDEGTINLYFGTHLLLSTLRSSRFFGTSKQIGVLIDSGTAEFSTPDLGNYASGSYSIDTPHAVIQLEPSSTVRVQFDGQGDTAATQAILEYGAAVVLSGGKTIPLQIGSMVVTGPGGPPEGPQAAQQDLIRNGDFTLPPTSGGQTLEEGGLGTAGWAPILDQPSASPPEVAPVSIVTETLKTQSVRAALIRKNENNSGYATFGLKQDINATASYFKQIQLKATVKVVSQTAPVGGPQGVVYPLTIKITYTDSNRQQQVWKHSFYWARIDLKISGATQVSQGSWEPEVFTLKSLGGASTPTPPPTTPGVAPAAPEIDSSVADISVINGIEIYGVGTGFQSWITGIQLVAR